MYIFDLVSFCEAIMKSLKKNIFLNAFRMSMNLLVPIITFSYTARIFLTEGSGQLSFAASTVEILSLFASLGIYTYGVREGTKRRDNFEDFTEFAWELININIIDKFS